MTPKCEQCKNFKKGKPHQCRRTGHSSLWERAIKLPRSKAPAGNGQHWTEIPPVRDNCGHEGQFFEVKA